MAKKTTEAATKAIKTNSRSFTYGGQEFRSKSACARHLVLELGKTPAEAAKIVGVSDQTVHQACDKNEKVAARRVRYQVIRLGMSGRWSASEIAERTGMSTSKVVAILKKEGIKPTKKGETKKSKSAKATETKKETKKTTKKTAKKPAETPAAKLSKVKAKKSKSTAPKTEEPVAENKIEETQEATA